MFHPTPESDYEDIPVRRVVRILGRLGFMVVVMLLNVYGVIGGCSSRSESSGPSTPTSDASETTAPPVDTTDAGPTEAVLAAYQEFWQVWLRANNPPNPEHPDLEKVATGQELATVKQSIAQKVADGTYSRLPENSKYRHEVLTVQVKEGVASVFDCAFDDGLVVRSESGEIVDSSVATQEILGSLVIVDDRWRVSSIRFLRTTPGEVQCAAF